MNDNFHLRLGDSALILNTIDAESIDLTVTSPPYDNLRTYNGFTFDFETIARELYRVTKPGGVVVWVVGDATVSGSETCTSFRQALFFKDVCGFNLHDTMIYQKAQACFGSNNAYLQAFEYMFVLSKGRPKTMNLLRDRPNKRSGVEKMASKGISVDGKKADRVISLRKWPHLESAKTSGSTVLVAEQQAILLFSRKRWPAITY